MLSVLRAGRSAGSRSAGAPAVPPHRPRQLGGAAVESRLARRTGQRSSRSASDRVGRAVRAARAHLPGKRLATDAQRLPSSVCACARSRVSRGRSGRCCLARTAGRAGRELPRHLQDDRVLVRREGPLLEVGAKLVLPAPRASPAGREGRGARCKCVRHAEARFFYQRPLRSGTAAGCTGSRGGRRVGRRRRDSGRAAHHRSLQLLPFRPPPRVRATSVQEKPGSFFGPPRASRIAHKCTSSCMTPESRH
jgi:hypothetical protein